MLARSLVVSMLDFDKKLIGGAALRWILKNKSNVIAAPA